MFKVKLNIKGIESEVTPPYNSLSDFVEDLKRILVQVPDEKIQSISITITPK